MSKLGLIWTAFWAHDRKIKVAAVSVITALAVAIGQGLGLPLSEDLAERIALIIVGIIAPALIGGHTYTDSVAIKANASRSVASDNADAAASNAEAAADLASNGKK